MTPRITASTPPSDWPLLLTVHEVALVLGIASATVSNKCYRGLMWPPPLTSPEGVYHRPFRWRKDVLEAYVENKLPTRSRYLRRAARNRRAA